VLLASFAAVSTASWMLSRGELSQSSPASERQAQV
jgi:hypothetical protein